jgi:hypothetical protein
MVFLEKLLAARLVNKFPAFIESGATPIMLPEIHHSNSYRKGIYFSQNYWGFGLFYRLVF